MARKCTTNLGCHALMFFSPPSGMEPQMDFTSFQYRFKDQAGGIYTNLSPATVAILILNPTIRNHNQLNSLLMKESEGVGLPQPAHLPSILNIYPIRVKFEVFIKWCLGSLPLRSFHPPHLKPALHVLDPKPIIDLDAPMFHLDNIPLSLCIGTYTDAFQLLKVPSFPHVFHLCIGFRETEVVPKYHKVDFTTFTKEFAPLGIRSPGAGLPDNTLVACWNVRGLVRPSMVDNFIRLYRQHRPSIIVLLETRQSYENTVILVNNLPGSYRFAYSAPIGLSGGVVVLWLDENIRVDQKRTYCDFVKMDMYLKGHPVSRKRLYED